ncbi:DUF72 domain-containing protein [Umezawaea sp. Da 62-37]|uniref:DUF72 domain-containing protein n=1 Tax=Umezawaea sp. Da 62-37 TaxID=3075927 RepID=UPI0028F6E3C2|nr:DUF72 domain-containing protein [Umezawaea sp. Da 62-37]WNV83760.1 DUF72 domain-containing protein [Umezawaea sp. Da 62-37]
MDRIKIGTSGWVYPPWRGVFYPPGLAQKRELEHLSQLVTSVEINSSFYSLQRPSSYLKWAAQTPDDFVFSLKGGRFITHLKRLRDSEDTLANFFASGVLALGPKLGPILWQLPPTLQFDPVLLDEFLTNLPRTTTAAAELATHHDERVDPSWTTTDLDRPLRHAVEVRHPSYLTPSFPELLHKHGIAAVVADSAGKYPLVDEVTTDFVYVRLHGADELYVSGYTDEALDRWAAKIRTWSTTADVYVYFDNDAKVMAPRDALALLKKLE